MTIFQEAAITIGNVILLVLVTSIEGFGINNLLWYIGLRMPNADGPPGIQRGMGA